MGSSTAELSDDSVSISDDDDAITESNVDFGSKYKAVDSPPPPSDSSPFYEGEKVLVFHNHHLYPGKVQKVEFRTKEWKYYVHYLGWNKNWDEWLGTNCLVKFTEEKAKEHPELNRKPATDKNEKPGCAVHSKSKNSSVARSKKRKNDSGLKEKNATQLNEFVTIHISPSLKKQLIDDCEFITNLGKLVKLPRSPNVDEILKKYAQYRMKKDGMLNEIVGEILRGLRCYFDKALPAMLLYKSERRQYQEVVADNVSPSSVYGAEHLLRLFVKLPEILYYARIEKEALTTLQQDLLALLKFLQKNQSAFFLSTYQTLES